MIAVKFTTQRVLCPKCDGVGKWPLHRTDDMWMHRDELGRGYERCSACGGTGTSHHEIVPIRCEVDKPRLNWWVCRKCCITNWPQYETTAKDVGSPHMAHRKPITTREVRVMWRSQFRHIQEGDDFQILRSSAYNRFMFQRRVRCPAMFLDQHFESILARITGVAEDEKAMLVKCLEMDYGMIEQSVDDHPPQWCPNKEQHALWYTQDDG